MQETFGSEEYETQIIRTGYAARPARGQTAAVHAADRAEQHRAAAVGATAVLEQLFNAADTAVVGSFGSADALAAVGTNTEIIALIVTGRNVKQVQHPQKRLLEFSSRGIFWGES